MRKIFVAAIFVLSFSTFTNAQGAVSYAFLEVVDSLNKPVAGAVVDIQGVSGGAKITNEKGQLDKGFPIGYGDVQTYGFSISKKGYFTFEDLGIFNSPYSVQSRIDKIRVELLKIPTNNAERRILGNEQQKRELFLAVRKRKTEEVRRLLKTGINPYISTNDLRGIPGPLGVSAIVYAAAQGDIETVKAFLNAGVNLRLRKPATLNILAYYISAETYSFAYPQNEEEKRLKQKYLEGIDVLIRNGADNRSFGEKGLTAMSLAVRKNDRELIERLIANGISIDSPNANGATLLMEYVRYPRKFPPDALDFVEFLLKSGANPNIVAGNKSTNIEDLCETPLINAVTSGQRELVSLLLKYKANAKFKCLNGKNALSAAFLEHPELTDLLVEAGADVNSKSQYGATPLMLAASRNSLPLVKVLLKNGAQINATDNIGRTALIYATQGYFNSPTYEMIEFLLKSGANPNAMSDNTHEYTRCVTPLVGAARRGLIDIMRLLFSYRADPNQTCLYGIPSTHTNPPIVEAARWGHLEAVKFLLENGADISGKYGERALYIVRNKLKEPKVENREVYEQIIKLLEAAGAK